MMAMNSSMSSKIVKIDPLTGKNWLSWSSMQKNALAVMGLSGHINSPAQPNVAVIPPFNPAAQANEIAVAPADATAQLEWTRQDQLALLQIKSSISVDEMYNTGDQHNTKTAYEVWQALHTVYTNTSMSAKMALSSALEKCKFDGTVSVQKHSNTLREIADRLDACGAMVSEVDLCERLLNSMPTEYNDVVSIFKYMPSASHQYFIILQTLIAKETEIKAKQQESERTTETIRAYLVSQGINNPMAMMVKRSTPVAVNRPRLQCTYEGCGKAGHTIDTCWVLHPELRRDRGGRFPKNKRQRCDTSDDEGREVKRHGGNHSDGRGGRPQHNAGHSQSGATVQVRTLLVRVLQPTGSQPLPMVASSPSMLPIVASSPSRSSLVKSPALVNSPVTQSLVKSPALVNSPVTQSLVKSPALVNSPVTISQARSPVIVVESALTALSSRGVDGLREWFVDSGASRHICSSREHMTDYKPMTSLDLSGITETVPAQGMGNLSVWFVLSGDRTVPIILRDVLFVPRASCNLIAVTQLVNAGQRVTFGNSSLTLQDVDSGTVWATITLRPGEDLFKILTIPRHEFTRTATAFACTRTARQVWHDRLGHLGTQQMDLIRRVHMVDGAERIPTGTLSCDSCFAGKSSRSAMPMAATHRSTRCLQLVHSDVCGPINIPNCDDARYVLTFIDDYSRSIAVYIMTTKTGEEVLTHLKDYKAWAETVTGERLVILRTDGGGEFLNRDANAFLTSNGISRQTTPPYTPQHNGVAERANRTIMNTVRAMLHRAGLSNYLWPEAVKAAVYTRNRCPSRALPNVTPYEAWNGIKPSVDELRVFGCVAHVHVPAERRQSKLSDRSVRCIHVGYSTTTKAWRLYNPVTGKIIVSRDVTFEEGRFIDSNSPVARGHLGEGELSMLIPEATVPPTTSSHGQPNGTSTIIEVIDSEFGDVVDDQLHEHISPVNDNGHEDSDSEQSETDLLPLAMLRHIDSHHGDMKDDDSPPSSLPAPSSNPSAVVDVRRSARGGGLASSRALDAARQQQRALTVQVLVAAAQGVQSVDDDPVTYAKAMSRDDHGQWQAAMESELDSIHRTGTWTLTDLPKGRQPIGCKWVYKIKRKADGSVDRYKARLVAKGFSQKEGVDYKETFAPVAKFTSIRLLLALAAREDYEIHQMDVKTAFLHGDLDVDIYMRQPEGFVEPGKERLVCHLKKSLYGLKQASRAWYHKIDAALSILGFTALASDHCIYMARDDQLVTFIVLYVDDLLLISNSLTQLTDVKRNLSKSFEMTDLGEVQYILGLQITRDRAARTLSLSQAEYTRRVVERYGMNNSKHFPTPLATGALLTTKDCPAVIPPTPTLLSGYTYASIVGALMYAMLGTRPDLAFAVGSLSRFNNNPGAVHWTHLKRVLRYLAGSINHKLTFGGDGHGRSKGDHGLVFGYCDADWATSIDDRRSITGWVFLAAGGAISWQSQRQKSVALSTVEAEYMAQCQAVKEAIWLRSLLGEVGLGCTTPMTIFTDSQGAMALAKNPEHHQRSKHIDIRYHFIREQVAQGAIELVYIPTSEMTADQLTKPLSRDQHSHCARLMGLER
jgi:transposase InsO family protein